MEFYLIPLAVFLAMTLLLRAILAKRYGRSLAIRTTSGVVLLSFLAAFITFLVFTSSTAENINPAPEWQKIPIVNVPASELQYRPQSGLFALTEGGEIKITGTIPFCSPDGDIANSHPSEIEITTEPRVSLSPPPQSVEQKVSFDLLYPAGADSWAASSFAVYENGEVWCTERLAQGGQTGAAALGFAAFIFLYWSAIIFVSSFVVLSVIAIISLEIHRWQKRRHKKNAH